MHILAFLSQLSHWQIDLLTFGLLIVSAVLTIVPEELLFITLGSLAHFGKVNPWEIFLAAQLGLIPADALTVWFGQQLGHKVMTRKPFSLLLGKDCLHKALGRLKRSSGPVLFLARFTPMLRAPVFLAAGVAEIPLRRTVMIDIVAASIQIAIFFFLGFMFGSEIKHLVSTFSYLFPALIVAGVACHFLKTALRRWKKETPDSSDDEATALAS